jgi:hypothetical protein
LLPDALSAEGGRQKGAAPWVGMAHCMRYAPTLRGSSSTLRTLLQLASSRALTTRPGDGCCPKSRVRNRTPFLIGAGVLGCAGLR